MTDSPGTDKKGKGTAVQISRKYNIVIVDFEAKVLKLTTSLNENLDPRTVVMTLFL